ncbi:MAG TPA: DsbA family oxidoreductase [Mycobacterium sp.]|nr:DsbA family oxidoreductase [Mycobacterium sp.]
MRIDVWSDVVCPFCYIGKRKLERALTQTGIDAQLRWHSFELDPAAPRLITRSLADLLAAKYRFGPERAMSFLEQQQRAAEDVGLEFNWQIARRGNTFDAHRLIHLARSAGRADAVTERFFRAYFTEGAAIGDPDTLRRLAVEAGLAAGEVDSVLDGDAYAADVRADERRAGELGIHAVPHFVIDERSAISGAADVGQFVEVLRSDT